MEAIISLINYVDMFDTILVIAWLVFTVFLVAKGVFTVWWKLWIGLAKRKIAIFAEKEYNSLNSMLIDSKIFSKTIQINKNDLKKAEKETIFLVYRKEFQDKIDEILSIKKDSTPLIVYAPIEDGRIDEENMKKINSHRNSIVVNFRGRLLNDIFTSLITTSYDR